MKKLRESIHRYSEEIDNRWKRLTVKKQHQYLMVLFTGYLLLTITVIFKIWYDTVNTSKKMQIKHIESPVIKKIPYKDPLPNATKNLFKNSYL